MEKTSLLDAIRAVKENEWAAAEFYGAAAQKAGSLAGRTLFEQLKEFELYHFARLSALEVSIQNDGRFIGYEGREFPQPPALAPQAAEEPQHQTLINIILRALELEQEAEKAYTGLADKIDDPQGKAMFERLAGEEHKHYRILTEAYWNLSNFKSWKWSAAGA